MKSNRQQRVRGFTLMELLVVLAILGLLVSLVGPQVLNQLGGAKSKTARIQIRDLEQALVRSHDDCTRPVRRSA